MLVSRRLLTGMISVWRHGRLLRIADRNHVLNHAATNTNQSELYRDPDCPVVSEVVEGIIQFLLEWSLLDRTAEPIMRPSDGALPVVTLRAPDLHPGKRCRHEVQISPLSMQKFGAGRDQSSVFSAFDV